MDGSNRKRIHLLGILYIAEEYLNDKYLKTSTMLAQQKEAFDAFYKSAWNRWMMWDCQMMK